MAGIDWRGDGRAVATNAPDGEFWGVWDIISRAINVTGIDRAPWTDPGVGGGGRAPTSLLPAALFLLAAFYYFGTNIYYQCANAPVDGRVVWQLEPYLSATNGVLPRPSLWSMLQGEHYYPPFFGAIGYLVALVFGADTLTFCAASAVLIFIGGMYVFFLLRQATGVWPALLGLSIFLFAPGMTKTANTFVIEAPLVLCVSALFYHLHASQAFARRNHCLALGFWTGLGLLTKWTFPAYACLACLIVTAKALTPPVRRRRWLNVALFAGLAAAIAGPWYIFNWDISLWARTAANDPTFPHYDYIGQFAVNMGKMLGAGLGWPFRWVFWPLLALGILQPGARRRLVLATAALIVFPVSLMALPAHQEPRYMVVLIPGVALLASAAVASFRSAIWRPVAGVATLLSVLLGHTLFYYPPATGDMFRSARASEATALVWGPSRIREVLEAVADEQVEPGAKRLAVAIHPFWNSVDCNHNDAWYWLAKNRNLRAKLVLRWWIPEDYRSFSRALDNDIDVLVLAREARDNFLSQNGRIGFNYAGVRKSMTWPHGEVTEPFAAADVVADVPRIESDFRLAKTLAFPDGRAVLIYRRRRWDGAPGVARPVAADPVAVGSIPTLAGENTATPGLTKH